MVSKFGLMTVKVPALSTALVSFFSIVCHHINLERIYSSDFTTLSELLQSYMSMTLTS
jgi:hypothetical protein